jgi:hypothetical protein
MAAASGQPFETGDGTNCDLGGSARPKSRSSGFASQFRDHGNDLLQLHGLLQRLNSIKLNRNTRSSAFLS